jgi:hypothetical protein
MGGFNEILHKTVAVLRGTALADDPEAKMSTQPIQPRQASNLPSTHVKAVGRSVRLPTCYETARGFPCRLANMVNDTGWSLRETGAMAPPGVPQ